MGSGNKLKRKQKNASGGGGDGPRDDAAPGPDDPFKQIKKKLGQPEPDPGVVFAIEPDADEIFRASMRQLDEGMLDRAREEEDFGDDAARSRAASRAPRPIDLHGMTLEEARWRVEGELDEAIETARGEVTFKIITGKGLHSGPGGAVLAREVHRLVRDKYARRITAIDASPDDVKLGGVPLRGHFDVRLRCGKI